MGHVRGFRARRAGLLAVTACVLPVLAAPGIAQAARAGSAHASVATITVKGSEFKFVLSKKVAPTGIVTFKFTNTGKLPHDFKINKVVTPEIGPGKSSTIKVAFRKAGSYPYICTVPGHAAAGMKGTLKVTGKPYTGPAPSAPKAPAPTPAPKPPANGVNSTINVTMGDYFFTFSTMTVPIGTVTFNITNGGATQHDLYVESGINKGSAQLNPGQTTTFSVVFTKAGSYDYICSVGNHAAMGMAGTLTITNP
jgi:plastocyanin